MTTTYKAKWSRDFLRRHILIYGPRRYVFLRLGVGWSHAERGGHCVLRDQASRHTINGVWINTRWGIAWLLFRRTA